MVPPRSTTGTRGATMMYVFASVGLAYRRPVKTIPRGLLLITPSKLSYLPLAIRFGKRITDISSVATDRNQRPY
jgi:hypothetical protein